MLERNRLKRACIASLAALAAILASACGVGEASTSGDFVPATATPLPVEVVTPVRAELYATYHTTTTLGSDADAPVLSRVEGEVIEILVEEGDFVEQGQVLAKLDGDRLRLEMIEAKANLDMKIREYERTISLHERGLVSAASFEGMKFDLDSLRATYELKQLNYGYTHIRATISGVISARDIKLGQHLNVNDPTFRVTNTSRLVAHLKIPQSEIAKFSAGQIAEIRVDAMPESVFVATIERVSPTIDSKNGTFRATAYIDNSDQLLAPGMFGRFDIAYEKHVDALTIPMAAVIAEDDQAVVYVVANGEAIRRPIQIGIEADGIVEVLGGIDENDQIVVTGQGSLRDGSRVLASIPANAPITG